MQTSETQTNFNHAEMKLGSYINDNYSNTEASVDIAIQNTSTRAQGMCSGCKQLVPELAAKNKKLDITIYHGTTGANP